jgi:molybdate transport system substrate-binding protein
MRRDVRHLIVVATILTVLLGLVACGGSATATPVPAPTTGSAASTSISAASASAAGSTTSGSTTSTSGTATASSAATSSIAAATTTRPASPAASPVGQVGTPGAAPKISGNLTVSAASSLTDAFNAMKQQIEAANPGTTITLNFGASSTLAAQLTQGAPVDVFASADQPNMDKVKQAGLVVGQAQIFAQNKAVIIVPVANPKGVTSPKDLAQPGVKLILTDKNVPIGNYARQILDKLSADPAYGADFSQKVLANLASEEANVRAVIAKVQLGEGDAGIVYSSDVTPSVRDKVKIIPIPDQFQITAQYPAAVIKGTGNDAGARAFIAYLLGPAGQAILQQWGFLPAPTGGNVPAAPGTAVSAVAMWSDQRGACG